MIFIDSWVWIEFFSKEGKGAKAERVLRKLKKGKGVISSTVLLEVRYRVKRKFGREKADQVTYLIQSFNNLDIVPVTEKVAIKAADLRDKYYERGEIELSYADAIHLATAIMIDCKKLYSGDPDFEEIDEIETEVI